MTFRPSGAPISWSNTSITSRPSTSGTLVAPSEPRVIGVRQEHEGAGLAVAADQVLEHESPRSRRQVGSRRVEQEEVPRAGGDLGADEDEHVAVPRLLVLDQGGEGVVLGEEDDADAGAAGRLRDLLDASPAVVGVGRVHVERRGVLRELRGGRPPRARGQRGERGDGAVAGAEPEDQEDEDHPPEATTASPRLFSGRRHPVRREAPGLGPVSPGRQVFLLPRSELVDPRRPSRRA